VRDADRIIGLLEANELHDPKLIVNRIRPHMVQRGDMMDINDILDILAIDLIGVIPEDETIVVSTNRGEPAVLDYGSKAGQAYRNIVRRIAGEHVPFMSMEEEKGFMTRFRKLFGFSK
jgi:septum site-determining protein MinD